MSRVIGVLLLAFAVTASALPTDFKDENRGSRIVNGTDVPQGKYPSVVAIKNRGYDVPFNFWCGGTIVNENYILTAAHCLTYGDFPSNYSVYAGDVDLGGNGVVIDAAEFIIHEGFNQGEAGNDIALIKLASPLTYDVNIQPVSLPEQLQETAGGTPASVLGWGLPFSGAGHDMQILQEVNVFVLTDADCLAIFEAAENFPFKPVDTNICAGVSGGGKGACDGDSGGPLFADGTQVGIVSWNIRPCGNTLYPSDVYAQVSYYVDWIAANAI